MFSSLIVQNFKQKIKQWLFLNQPYTHSFVPKERDVSLAMLTSIRTTGSDDTRGSQGPILSQAWGMQLVTLVDGTWLGVALQRTCLGKPRHVSPAHRRGSIGLRLLLWRFQIAKSNTKHTYAHTHACTHAHTHTHTHTHACAQTCTHTHTHTNHYLKPKGFLLLLFFVLFLMYDHVQYMYYILYNILLWIKKKVFIYSFKTLMNFFSSILYL